jgi:outer membrane protein assembly factor BamB
MRVQGTLSVVLASIFAGGVTYAQVNRGWSDWLTAQGDAQRSSWIRTDPKISVDALSAPGFELQWSTRLGNQPRGLAGLMQGVTASGVTLFVPMSLVAGSSNNLYAIDNDTGYVVWERKFDATLPALTGACTGGITAAATRIVSAAPAPTPPPVVPGAAPAPAGRGAVGYRSLLGEPGEGAPVEARGGGAGRGAAPAAAPPGRAGGAAAPPAGPAGEAGFARQGGAGAGGGRGAQVPGIPGAPETAGRGGLGRPSGVVYVVSSDGMLRVVGLQSGKDLQQPARFLPANAQWSNALAVGTTLYAATSGNCGGAPAGVWAIDLSSATTKPVVSYATNGGSVVGPVAMSTDGNTLFASIGAGTATGEGKANAVVALDARTLQLKDWFSQPTSEFVTGPTVFRHGTKDVVAAATRDGRVLLLDGTSLGGASHATPLASRALVSGGGSVSDAMATWEQATAPVGSAPPVMNRWILVPVSGRPSGARTVNGSIQNGAVVAVRVRDTRGVLSLEPAWTSHNLSTPAAPIVVNGVVFALGTGRPGTAGAAGTPAVLHAYDGATGKALWNSGKVMTAAASPGSFWSALSQAYVGTSDGTLYAFGFLDERR